jgi:hypothetical protein
MMVCFAVDSAVDREIRLEIPHYLLQRISGPFQVLLPMMKMTLPTSALIYPLLAIYNFAF